MFVSFFPSPRNFFLSLVAWSAVVVASWYLGGDDLGAVFGLPPLAEGEKAVIGASLFWSTPFLWFYVYFAVATFLFYGAWRIIAPHPWMNWSVLGSALILFVTYFNVQVSVATNAWYGPFYDLIQAALSKSAPVTIGQFYGEIITVGGIFFIAITIGVLNRFFVSHWIFRWRTAMNNYYMEHWKRLRTIEGASQRVQEDTMRFSATMEGLGVNLIDAIMTLLAFLPVLMVLSASVKELPIIGEIPHPLVFVALAWSAFGTGFLALVGIKLPGLEFRNQRVEAAYRKELVYGEDDPDRAEPPTVRELFHNVRKNYFRLYFHYMYFNIARIFYLQVDNLFPYMILAPTIVAGGITLGVMNQILNAFGQVRSSFQYLVNSWTVIVDLLSVYKRLRAFESAIHGEELPSLDREYLEKQAAGEPVA